MRELLESARGAARIGGEVLLRWRGRIHAREKAPNDLVTEADLESQGAIRRYLSARHPDHLFLGEEAEPADLSGRSPEVADRAEDRYCWIVDPLDGTANYVHGLPNFSVSVGLRRGDELLVGAVYDPVSDEMYSAGVGLGSLRNDRPIRTSGRSVASEAMVATSLPAQVRRDSPEIAAFIELLLGCRVVRRLGSAALNLCYVADGRMDAYWATSVHIWDVAAGIVILTEAGGVIRSPRGGPVSLEHPRFVASATPELGADLRRILAPTED